MHINSKDGEILASLGEEAVAGMFRILDDIRESGEVNMGAATNILINSGFERSEARALTRGWMATFDGRSSVKRRAMKACGTTPTRPRLLTMEGPLA